jgi:hypothetical protein
MKRILLFIALAAPICGISIAAAQASDADFASRCAAAGVIKCVGFDNETSDIVRDVNLHPDSHGNYRGGLDTVVKTSGDGSLRFDLPPPPHAGPNIAGRWSPVDSGALGQTFGQNSTFYVQFRQRFSPEMLDNEWKNSTPGWKTVIFHQGQSTCAAIELATANWWNSNIVFIYTDCGARAMTTTPDGSQWTTHSPPFLIQQGDYSCEYNNFNQDDCFYFTANEWLTFYYKISLGTWDQPDSMVELWIAREGTSSYQQIIRVPNMSLSCNAASCTTSPGLEQGYNNLTFTPYMTGLSSNDGIPGVTARTWIDELIVSTQPIAAPASGPRPESPTNLTAQ